MRTCLALFICLVPAVALAQTPVAGDWVLTEDIYGNPLHQRLTVKVDGPSVSGTIGRRSIDGTVNGTAIRFTLKGDDTSDEFSGTISGDRIEGTLVRTAKGEQPFKTSWTAARIPTKRAGPPQRHEFVPTTFHRQFSASNPPVLRVWPGDTIHTTTVDAGGTDEKSVTRVLGGNPQTGPFYVETAMPGDVLVVHLNRLRLNRDWAISDDGIVGRALDPELAVKMKDGFKNVRWRLDRQRGVAMPETPTEHLKNFTVPLRPMLGCVAVATGFGSAPPPTGDSGRFGGNMDFNEIVEGATVYLPVAQPGALLYVGDGHAAQGDGELNGNALETSMDVEFTVDVVTRKPVMTPRVESATHIMTVGLGGTLEDALRAATAGLAQWLEQDFQLTPSEIAIVLGSSVEYTIGEVADRNTGVVAKMRKDRLSGLTQAPPIAAGATAAPGQAPVRFEVAAVKSNVSGDAKVVIQMLPGGRFTATNATLRQLIRNAYQLQEFQITGGPAWLDRDRFDIVAKADGAGPDNPGLERKARAMGLPPVDPEGSSLFTAVREQLGLRLDSQKGPVDVLVIDRAERPKED
jgi:acetamidase/formamidase